jgi:hypothetical protein
MARELDLVIDQGTDFSTDILMIDEYDNNIDLTGYTGAAQMRRFHTSNTYYSFTVSTNVNNAVITLSMTSNTTNTIPDGRYLWDCEIINASGTKSRLREGIVTVTPQITR